MTHVVYAPRTPSIRPDLVLAVALAGLIGFAIGQAEFSGLAVGAAPTGLEDWHGNVMRSGWTPEGTGRQVNSTP